MKYSTPLYLMLISSWWSASSAFLVQQQPARSSSRLYAEEAPPGPPPDLIAVSPFIEAIESIQGAEPCPKEDHQYFAIGKTTVSLNIQESPGMDLSESPLNSIVVVSGAVGKAEEAGINPGDTIRKISAVDGSYEKVVKDLNLQEVVGVIQEAATHAIENKRTEIELELNRLMKIRFTDEEAQ